MREKREREREERERERERETETETETETERREPLQCNGNHHPLLSINLMDRDVILFFARSFTLG